jgi:CRP-like cAMP-binding protein
MQPDVRVQRVLLLSKFEAFRDLAPAELTVLAENAQVRRFKRGARLFRPGAVIHSAHFVVHGRVGIRREGEQVREFGNQSVIGGLSAFMGQPETLEYVALEDTVTLELRREDMEDVFEDNFRIFIGVLAAMARALLELRQKLASEAGFPAVGNGKASREFDELGLVEKIFLLRENMNFAQTRIEALADLAQESQHISFEPDTVLWQVGDVSDHSLMLVSGIIECQNETQRFAFDPGSTVGGLDSVAQVPRWYEARARTPVLALRIETQRLLDVIEDNMEMGIDMLRVFATDLRQLQERLDIAGSNRPSAPAVA